MIAKIFKGVWLFSALAVMADFLYTYASLPESVVLLEGSALSTISRDILFYSTLIILGVANTAAFVISRSSFQREEAFKVWFQGVIIFLNLYLLVSLQFISLINSNEKFAYESIGSIIYGTVVILILWTISWPFYGFLHKLLSKQPV